jgi:spore maturation protein CgeB
VYPEEMVSGKTLVTYSSSSDVVAKLEELLRAPHKMACIADAGYRMVTSRYSKERQWSAFQTLVSGL